MMRNFLEDHADIIVLVVLALFLVGGLAGYQFLRGR
jgi:uncharacterized membrane protein